MRCWLYPDALARSSWLISNSSLRCLSRAPKPTGSTFFIGDWLPKFLYTVLDRFLGCNSPKNGYVGFMAKSALLRACEIAGGQKRLAERIGTTQSQVWYWLERSKRGVPAEFVLPIEQATGVGRTE